MSPSLIASPKPIIALISLPLHIWRLVALLGLNMAILGLEDTPVVLASFLMTLISCVRS
jgi:ABC-type proline/glycine betaine transport system permease subunit